MKQTFHGKYLSGVMFKGVSGLWRVNVSHLASRTFNTEDEALGFLKEVGCID